MERIKDYLVFDNDSDFEEFAVDTQLKIHEGKGMYWYDWDFTSSYYTERKKGTMFAVRDPKSSIVKRGCVTYHSVSKPVELEVYEETE